MARPVLLYDDSTGSDTAASGAGPATAITGSSAASTSGASTTISFSNTPDLSGVAADDILYLETTSGRKLTRIVSVNDGADTVVVEESFNISSAVNYAIGGKRQTFDNDTGRYDWLDWKAGWTVELNDGGEFLHTVAFAPVFGDETDGSVVVRTEAGYTTKAAIKSNTIWIACLTNANRVAGGSLIFQDIEFNNQGASDGDVMEIGGYDDSIITFERCDIRGFGPIYLTARVHLFFIDCTHENTGTDSNRGMAFNFSSGVLGTLRLLRCRFTDIAREVFKGDAATAEANVMIEECIFDSCGGSTYDAVVFALDQTDGFHSLIFRRNAVYNSGNSGLVLHGTLADAFGVIIEDNIFEDNGGYGIEADDSNFAEMLHCKINNNSYYSNTSGESNNITEENAITQTASAFTDAANGDFSLNATAGGGPLVDDTGLEIAN